MDDIRFDQLVKALASSGSRRTFLKGMFGTGVAVASLGLPGQPGRAARRPTPTPRPVSCPGQQVWDGAMCVCPSGIACGPDCCASADQCCDNACCAPGSVCVAEEQCCPVGQVCPSYVGGPCCPDGTLCCPNGDACFDPVGGCCATSDCPTDYCNPVSCENNVCVYQPLPDGTDCGDCAACSGGVCVSTCAGTCCPADDACVDLANGGCCSVDDCPPRTCQSVSCDEHICAYQSFANGTDCGDCALCQDGACTNQCTPGETCCSDTDTCVDLENGGCCGDTDCPPDPAPCAATCSDNWCRPSRSVACESLDGEVCCAYGETCVPFSVVGQSANFCCEPATTPCIDAASNDIVCCGGSNSCQELTFTTSVEHPLCQSNPALCLWLCNAYPELCESKSFPICCPGDTEVCYGPNVDTSFCCGVGQTCNQVTTGGTTVGQCCDAGTDACYDFTSSGVHLTCCGAGEACKTYNDAGQELQACCPASLDFCRDSTGWEWECCGEGSSCQNVFPSGTGLEACCPNNTEACYQPGKSSLCCAEGQSCKEVESPSGPYGHCCLPNEEACMDPTDHELTCCGNGSSCQNATVNGVSVNFCCPSNSDVCIDSSGSEFICCGNGSTCQELKVEGLTYEICCPANTKPCQEPVPGSFCCPV